MQDKELMVAQLLEAVLRAVCPYDSGNLSRTIHANQDEEGHFVSIGNEVYDYAAATNEPWVNRKGNNPNEGWVEHAIESCIPQVEAIYAGKMTEEELAAELKKQDEIYKATIQRRADEEAAKRNAIK